MLQGKVAVVTGAARGMGARPPACSWRRGQGVVRHRPVSWDADPASRNDRGLRRLAKKELESRPDEALVLTCDVGDEGQIHAAYDEAMTKFGTADFLFNNAGVRHA